MTYHPNWSTSGGQTVYSGRATIPFATWLAEDSVAVTGQTSLQSSTVVVATVLADNDEVASQDWGALVVSNIVAGTGFTLRLRANAGTFKGNVKVNWRWV